MLAAVFPLPNIHSCIQKAIQQTVINCAQGTVQSRGPRGALLQFPEALHEAGMVEDQAYHVSRPFLSPKCPAFGS